MKIFTGTLFECIMIIVSISCFKSVLNIQSDSQVQKIEKDIPWIILKKAYALDSFKKKIEWLPYVPDGCKNVSSVLENGS